MSQAPPDAVIRESKKDPSTRGMTFIFITLLIDVLGFGLIIPITPGLVQQLSHVSVSDAAIPYTELATLYGLMQFVFAPILGSLSDRYGRRPVLLISLACGAVDLAAMALAPTLLWLFIGRTISGIAGASFTAASAYIADISPPEKRAQNFGMIGAAFGIGFVVGPTVGGLLGHFGLRVPFWAAFVLSLANCLYGYFILPESLPPDRRRKFSLKSSNTIGSAKLLLRYSGTALLAITFLLNGLAQQFLQNTWILYTTYRLGWTTVQNGIGLGLVGLCVGGVQAGLGRTLIPKLGEARSLLIGFAINALGFLMFGLSVATWMMYGTIIVWSMGAIAGPSAQSIMTKAYKADEQGAVQGALMSIQSICMVFGPIAAGAIFRYATSEQLRVKVPGAVFFASAVLASAALLFSVVALKKPELHMQPDAA